MAGMGFMRISDIIPEAFAWMLDKQGGRQFYPEPVYMPGKYESPIEDIFAWHITKYLNPEVKFYAQYPVKTICGSFRIDFVAVYDGVRIAFECDGKNFHDPERDLWRDAMILGDDHVDVIFRLRGRDIYTYPADLIYTISRWHSRIFSLRGQANLLRLALESTQNSCIDKRATSHLVEVDDEANDYRSFLEIDRRFRHTFDRGYLWDTYYKFARNVGGGKLDEIMKLYERNF